MDSKKALSLTKQRTKLIDGITSKMETLVTNAQRELYSEIVDSVLDKLEKDENGNIKNTQANKRLLSVIDDVFQEMAATQGVLAASTFVDSIQKVTDFNLDYYTPFAEKTKLVPISQTVEQNIKDWLGINQKGGVEKNGYLDTLINDTSVRNKFKDMIIKAVVGQSGYAETKTAAKVFIQGDEQNLGAMQKYYRNFVYDTFSQVDRSEAKMYADKLGFNYAIYEGGLIETSRPFCIKRNGKVFSREEISKFNPPTAKQPDYNPFVDLGGYGCRHHLNWIPDAIAFVLRPDLKNAA